MLSEEIGSRFFGVELLQNNERKEISSQTFSETIQAKEISRN